MEALAEPSSAAEERAAIDDAELVRLAISACGELANGRGFGPLDQLIASLPEAVAPELADGSAPNHKTDVFAVAAAMRYLSAGRELPKPLAAVVRQGTSSIPEHRPGPALLGAELARAARRLDLPLTPPTTTSMTAPPVTAVPVIPEPVVEPEPVVIEPESVIDELVVIEPEPLVVEPERLVVEPEPVSEEPVVEEPVVEEPVVEELVEPEPEPAPTFAPVDVAPAAPDEPTQPLVFASRLRPAAKVAVAMLSIAVALAGAYVGFRAANRSSEISETAVEGTSLAKGPVAADLQLSVDHFALTEGPNGQSEVKVAVTLDGQFNRAVKLPSGPGARLALATGPLTGPWTPVSGTSPEPIEIIGGAAVMGVPEQPITAIAPNPGLFQENFQDSTGATRLSQPTTLNDVVLNGKSRIEATEAAGNNLVFRIPKDTNVVGVALLDDDGAVLAAVPSSQFGPPEPADSF